VTRFPPLELDRLKTYSIFKRPSKVHREYLAKPWSPGGGFGDFLTRLPGFLAAGDFIEAVDRLAEAVQNERTVILGMGGHPIKVGLSPVIIDLMKRGIISLVAVNGSVMVHDTELAMIGSTSEDVASALADGTFGMGREANQFINASAIDASNEDLGLGLALGRKILNERLPYAEDSVFAAGVLLEVPVTVHVALGTDVYHVHPEADGAAIGRAGMRDFRTFCAAVTTLEKGVFINLGSAVIVPEVFLKAVSLARNLERPLRNLTTVNMDFIRQYRPQVNVVERPTADGGRGYHFTGHHELMFPLLAAALIERLNG